ncbi:IS4 family transposase [Membranicola marinus]|uniref:IS4 family transposase n=2 Tax=Membranihabitans marinus TaxID=1227546 RepID=A0A953HPJ2_9BACT|nr:IS4 family transposase [Membranihabitans marinus]
MHAVLDYDLGLPNYAYIKEGKTHDIKPARTHSFPSDSVIVVDRAYVDFVWLNNLDSNRVIYVTRLKKNVNFEIVKELPVNEKHEHILSDQIIKLTGDETRNKYSGKIRVIEVYDPKNDQILILMTNNFNWTAGTVSQLYKARWDVEVFFKFIKQLFRVKTFVGTSPNAVRIQLWCSLIAMILFRYLKQKAEYKWNLSNLVTLLRVHLFSKIDLWTWINKPILEKVNSPPEITLFD